MWADPVFDTSLRDRHAVFIRRERSSPDRVAKIFPPSQIRGGETSFPAPDFALGPA